MENLLTVADVARLADLTPDAVRLAETAGRIRAAGRTAGGTRLFCRAEAERFAAVTRRRRDARGAMNRARAVELRRRVKVQP